MSHPHPPDKDCAVCGRTITWRKSLAKNWDGVRYCSDACRRRRRSVETAGADLEAEVLRMRDARSGSATTCPSEIARAVAPEDWRPLMEPVREAARRLRNRGEVEWLQGGQVVDPSTAKGPVRLRRIRHG